MTVRSQDGVSFTYNVRADATAFQQIYAGMALAGSSNDPADLQKAEGLVQQGIQGVITPAIGGQFQQGGA